MWPGSHVQVYRCHEQEFIPTPKPNGELAKTVARIKAETTPFEFVGDVGDVMLVSVGPRVFQFRQCFSDGSVRNLTQSVVCLAAVPSLYGALHRYQYLRHDSHVMHSRLYTLEASQAHHVEH